MRRWLAVLPALALAGCNIHTLQPYRPDTVTAFQAADAADASADCFDATTPAEHAVCASPALKARARDLTLAFAGAVQRTDIFGRDAVMAMQRAWLLALPDSCHLSGGEQAASTDVCLAAQIGQHIQALQRIQAKQAGNGRALAQYVKFRIAPGTHAADPALCQALARDANEAVAQAGTVNPALFATEIAGTHGAAEGDVQGRRYTVTLVGANAFGGFEQRARGVSSGGVTLLDPSSLGALEQLTTANNGARFTALASQTGDYGAADVFVRQGRVLAFLEEPWGYFAPASPGEYAHAGVWDVSAATASPLCAFDTFRMPAGNDSFSSYAHLTALRDTLAGIAASAQPLLGPATLRDQGQLRNAANWTVLNMPLIATADARTGDWTPWLRRRHDQVLDALFSWSTKAADNKSAFDKLFAELKPAAQDLVTAYQSQQGLNGSEAKDAAGLAIMELLYGATVNVAPALGADPNAPASASGYTPRYPIIAAPG